MTPEFTLPIREDLVGIASYGAPQLDVPARLNVNENPFPIPDDLATAMGAAVAEAAIGLNRYPDRDAGRLRQALADYLADESAVRVPAAQVWAANGSNEVMHHLFLAFGGPGRLAITFDPTYSMYPEYARDTFTDFEAFPRRDDFRVDVAAAIDVILTPPALAGPGHLAEQPDGHGHARGRHPGASRPPRCRPGPWSSSTRPTPSSGTRACPARAHCSATTRT